MLGAQYVLPSTHPNITSSPPSHSGVCYYLENWRLLGFVCLGALADLSLLISSRISSILVERVVIRREYMAEKEPTVCPICKGNSFITEQRQPIGDEGRLEPGILRLLAIGCEP